MDMDMVATAATVATEASAVVDSIDESNETKYSEYREENRTCSLPQLVLLLFFFFLHSWFSSSPAVTPSIEGAIHSRALCVSLKK